MMLKRPKDTSDYEYIVSKLDTENMASPVCAEGGEPFKSDQYVYYVFDGKTWHDGVCVDHAPSEAVRAYAEEILLNEEPDYRKKLTEKAQKALVAAQRSRPSLIKGA